MLKLAILTIAFQDRLLKSRRRSTSGCIWYFRFWFAVATSDGEIERHSLEQIHVEMWFLFDRKWPPSDRRASLKTMKRHGL